MVRSGPTPEFLRELGELSLGAGCKVVQDTLHEQILASEPEDARARADAWFDYLIPIFHAGKCELPHELAETLSIWIDRHWTADVPEDVERFCALIETFDLPGGEALMQKKRREAPEAVQLLITEWIEAT